MNIFLHQLMVQEVSNLLVGIDFDTLYANVVAMSPSARGFTCDDLLNEEGKKIAFLNFLLHQPDESFAPLVSIIKSLSNSKAPECSQKSEQIVSNQNLRMSTKKTYMNSAEPMLHRTTNESKGVAIIFNMGIFMSKHEMRSGSDKDVEHLVDTFKNCFNMDVKLFENLTRDAVKRKIECLSESKKLSDYDIFILVFMSHGHCDPMNQRSVNFITYDGALVNSEWIVNQFSESICPQLSGKPKLFFFQSCRTPHEKSACWIPPYSLVPLISEFQREEQFPLISVCRDMFLVYSTSVGNFSFRDSLSGSHFIQALCESLKNDSSCKEFCALMDEVNQKLKSDERNPPVVIESRGISKRVYIRPFKPNIPDVKKSHSPIKDLDWSPDSSPEYLVV